MDIRKLNEEREKEIAKEYRQHAERLADDAQRKAAIDKVCILAVMKCYLLYDITCIKIHIQNVIIHCNFSSAHIKKC